ncbi:MAG: LOG family protein, partial [Schleiferiaceae bacterium]
MGRDLRGARVTVYCAGSARVAQDYVDGASELAQALVDAGATLVFGGGKTGLMGHMATEVIQRGGKASGVMPQFLKDIEMNHPLVTDFTFVATMAERKAGLLANTEG